MAWVWTDLNRLKQHSWHDCKQPPFSFIDWNVLYDVFYAVTDHRQVQISSHNSHPTFCWVNLEDFLILGTLYCLISDIRGNIMCIDTGTYDTICISLTLAIRYIDVSVNRYILKLNSEKNLIGRQATSHWLVFSASCIPPIKLWWRSD